MAAETTSAQCHAITEDGERCERPAGEDGFCHQHDESDPTIDEYDEAEGADDDAGDAGTDDGDASNEDGDAEDATAEGDDAADQRDGDEATDGSDGSEASTGLEGVRDVRETVQTLAPEIIGRELDAVIEVDRRDDGWLAVVEVVERPAVPDTQDILGRYEIDLADGAVTGYRRIDRYRRSDTDAGDGR